MTAFVADTVDQLAVNPQTKQTFDRADLQRVKHLLAARICALTGGKCIDSGAPLRQLHAGHHGATEFVSLIESLRESMRARDVPLAARNELLEILGPESAENRAQSAR